MRIGVLTLFHGNRNWGGNLQGYALKSYIEENFPNCSADLIQYRSGKNVIYKNKLEQMLQYGPIEAIKKISQQFSKKKTPGDDLLKDRIKRFEMFQKKYQTNKHIYKDEDLQDLAEEYDCLICGSDQVWNPNVARPGFFLEGVTGTKKVSYAASIARDSLSKKEADAIISLIEQFDCISVREKTAKTILDGYLTGKKDVQEVLDPALMLTKEQWSQYIGDQEDKTEPYALAFFFSDSLSYRKKIEQYCAKHHLKLVGIPHATNYIRNDEIGDYEKAYDVGPIEFLRLFREASCVFTDSFHGAAFSILFEKPFCVFERDKKSKTSKNSRLYDLLSKFQLSERLVKSHKDFIEALEAPIDYTEVYTILERERAVSHKFLQDALGSVIEKSTASPITVADLKKTQCCGCGLCANSCPKGCITMRTDSEGFLYPIVDTAICTSCGLCVKQCTGITADQEAGKRHDAYIGYHSADQVREESSSGGIFHALARQVIQAGGVVYGAAYDADFLIKHTRISELEALADIMKSKYVQSALTDVWVPLSEDMKSGKTVLFSGTPCQVAAISRLAALNKAKNNLILVDFICHGTPSPELWKSYLGYVAQGQAVKSVNFRDKKQTGWHDYAMHIVYGENRQFRESHEINAYMRTFLSDRNIRPACYHCRFKGEGYCSDITLADAWKIEKEYAPWADDKGTSLFIVRSEKGQQLLDACQDQLNVRPSDYECWTTMNPSLVQQTSVGNGRKAMFDDFSLLSNQEFWEKYRRVPVKKAIRYCIKKLVKALKLGRALRRKL